ncbi:MAG: hypothetical protein JO060_03025 [Candidatus Eremiobacteraeota bacterium]|nr:hypothetical protein [Candidatus Eremiobacteraeota bacterium]MBV9648072.1 hypothetical protein [Candidatus Eremiobacteraeota bacterium]
MAKQENGGTGTVDDLLNLLAIDPETLREAEFSQAQAILESMVGETVAAVLMEDRRIVILTTSGNRYFFYGFMGNSSHRQ